MPLLPAARWRKVDEKGGDELLREDGRYCDGCAQKLPPMAKLGQQMMSKEEAREYESTAAENADGTVTIDLCLQCRIRRAERLKAR